MKGEMTLAKLTEVIVRDLRETCMDGSPIAEDCDRYIAAGYDEYNEDVDADFATSADRIVDELNRRALVQHVHGEPEPQNTSQSPVSTMIVPRARRVPRPDGVTPRGPTATRGMVVHLEHPGGDGATALCGSAPARLRVCPECARIREALSLVHVRSVRKPERAMCGLELGVSWPTGARRPAPGELDWIPTPMYLSAERALAVLAPGCEPGFPVCPGCELNLRRQETRAGGRGRLTSCTTTIDRDET
jgi:hypothetical protein